MFSILPTFQRPLYRLFLFHIGLSVVEVVSLGSIFPILFLVVDPEVINRPSKTKTIYDALGFTSHQDFFIALVILFAVGVVFIHTYKLWLHKKTFSLFVDIQRHVEKKSYQQLFMYDAELSEMSHPAQESRKQFFLAQRYVNYVSSMLSIAKSSVTLVLIFGVLVIYDWKLVVAMILAGCAYYALVFRFFRKKTTNLDEEEVLQTGGLMTFWQDTLQIRHLFWLGTRSQKNLRIFHSLQDKIQSVRYRRDMYRFIPQLLLESCFILGVLAFLLYAFEIEMISFVPFLALFGVAGLRALIAMDGIYQGLIGISIVGNVKQQTEQLFAKQIHLPDTGISISNFEELRFSDLSFGYDTRMPAVIQSLSLTIPSGGTVCFLGKSGIGKTTCMEVMAGFLEPTSGSISVDEKLLDSPLYMSHNIGFVRQNSHLISGTLLENIAFGVEEDELDMSRISDVADVVCIGDFIDTLQDGYDTPLGPDGVRLSAGQRQRVILARELYRKPQILFLDEVTNGLDRQMSETLVQNLIDLGTTLIFATHKEWLCEFFDTAYHIEHGKVIAH